MDWLSFILGFIAFPLLGVVCLGIAFLARRLLAGQDDLGDVSVGQRGATLSFSSRLIGEIGERLESETGPTAKAS